MPRARLTSRSIFAAIFCLSFTWSTPTQAGPWLQEEGKGQLISSALYYHTSHFINTAGHRRTQPEYSKYELNPYLEYGITPRWTVGFSTFLDYLKSKNPTSNHSNMAMADTEIFARTALYQQGNLILSVEPAVKLPSLYRESCLPRSGTEEWDARLGLGAGYSFDAFGQNHYITASPAFRHRFGPEGDQFMFDLSLGLRPADRWLILPQFSTTWRLSEDGAFTQSARDDYSLAKLQFSVVYDITPALAFQIGAYHHLYARNTGTGGGLLVALWKKF